MGHGSNGVIRQTNKKGSCNGLTIMRVSGPPRKPTCVDISNDIVDAMKRLDPQEVANILLSKNKIETEWVSLCKFGVV